MGGEGMVVGIVETLTVETVIVRHCKDRDDSRRWYCKLRCIRTDRCRRGNECIALPAKREKGDCMIVLPAVAEERSVALSEA